MTCFQFITATISTHEYGDRYDSEGNGNKATALVLRSEGDPSLQGSPPVNSTNSKPGAQHRTSGVEFLERLLILGSASVLLILSNIMIALVINLNEVLLQIIQLPTPKSDFRELSIQDLTFTFLVKSSCSRTDADYNSRYSSIYHGPHIQTHLPGWSLHMLCCLPWSSFLIFLHNF